jgi:methyltransferase
MVVGLITVIALVAFQRLMEVALANRNCRWMMARGGREFGGGHYPLFFILHASWLAGWLDEALWRGPALAQLWPLWLALFLMAQGLRYWCIISLGRYWNTRILVIPGVTAVSRGPYRYLRHPNYLAVALELACGPLIFDAWLTALITTSLNAWLLLAVRIPAEETALRQLENSNPLEKMARL